MYPTIEEITNNDPVPYDPSKNRNQQYVDAMKTRFGDKKIKSKLQAMIRYKYFIFLVFVLFNACADSSRESELNLPDNGKIFFTDPLNDAYYLSGSDTVSDNEQERTVFLKHKARTDSTREIIIRWDDLHVFKCDTLNATESLRLERDRVFNLNGYGSINDSGIINNKKLMDVVFIRYNADSYVVALCNKGRYIRFEFLNFGDDRAFKEMLRSIRIQ